MFTKKIEIDGIDVTCTIWDTAGEEKTNSLSNIYYKGA